MVTRDSQVSRLYAAEIETWFSDHTWVGERWYRHPPLDFDNPRELQQFVNKVTGSKFWRQAGGRAMVHAKANNRWSNFARGREQQMDIPPWAMTKSSVLHELTHSLMFRLAPRTAYHGPEFVLVFRRLTEEHMGTESRRTFDLVLESHGVRWGIGSIPPGKIAPGNPDST